MSAHLINTLWESARNSMTDEQLDEVCRTGDDGIRTQIEGMTLILEDLASQLYTDDGTGDRPTSSAISSILFCVSESLRAATESLAVVSAAEATLRHRAATATTAQ